MSYDRSIFLENRDHEDEQIYSARLNVAYPQISSDFWIFLHRHITVWEIRHVLEPIDFSKLKLDTCKFSNKEINAFENLFPDFVSETAENVDYHIEKYRGVDAKIVNSWKNLGTWLVPIIVLIQKSSPSNLSPKPIVIEGHTRLGILYALLNGKSVKYTAADLHTATILVEG